MPQSLGNAPYLLFHDTEEDLHQVDLEKLQQSSELDAIFPNHCFLSLVTLTVGNTKRSYVLVTMHPGMYPTPDKADTFGIPMRVCGRPEFLYLRHKFNGCRSLIKNALGCAKCPDNGLSCLKLGLPSTWDCEEMNKLRNMKTQIAGFTYVSPVLTRQDHFEFTERDWVCHNFDLVAPNHKMRVENAQEAAATRNFRKKACNVCPLKGFCKRWEARPTHCNGPMPSSDEIDRLTLAKFMPLLKEAPFPEWQFWAASLFAGHTSDEKHANRRVRFTGIKLDKSDGFRFQMYYDAAPMTEAFTTSDYETIRVYVPHLPATAKEARELINISDHAKALYFASLERHWGSEHRTFCGSASYDVGYRVVNRGSVSVHWRHSRCFGLEDTVDSWRAYADTFGHKPDVPHQALGSKVGQ